MGNPSNSGRMERSQEAKKLLQSARAIIFLSYETIEVFFELFKSRYWKWQFVTYGNFVMQLNSRAVEGLKLKMKQAHNPLEGTIVYTC